MSAGMTVDEIERRAKAVLADDWLPENHREKVLARFVLAVLPVVRVADRWVTRLMDAPSYTALDPDERALIEAVDAMRAAMGEKGEG